MAINKRSRLDDFTRGSDALWHSVHMALAGVQRLVIVAGSVAVLLFAMVILMVTGSAEREIIFKHYLAELYVLLGLDMEIILPTPSGPVKMSASQAASITGNVIGWHGFLVFLVAACSIYSGIYVARRIGKHQMKIGADEANDKFLRGQQTVDVKALAELTKGESTLGYQIGSVGIPDRLIARCFAFIGSMGAGKSQAIFSLMDAPRRHTKAVIYDSTGDFVERFYDPSRGDVILNPLDKRCAAWSIFSDLKEEIDYTTVAGYFIPEAKGGDGQNAIFVKGARVILEDVMKLVQMEPGLKKTMREVARIAMLMPVDELHNYFMKHGLPAAGLMTPENLKASASFRMELTAAPALRFFKLFDNEGFSITDFIESDSTGWLFLTSHPKQREVINPFVATWLELAVMAAMSMPKIDYTRVLLSIDELANLPRLAALKPAMTEGRKYGISTILGFQNIAQGREIYGHDLFQTVMANAQTKAIFRTEEFESAKAFADFLGAQEVDEATAGNTHGTDAAKDSSQISRKRTETTLVMPSQILTLPDLTAYLKVAGGYPVAQVKIPYIRRPSIARDYELRSLATIKRVERAEPAGEDVPEWNPEWDLMPVAEPNPDPDDRGLF